MKELIPQHLVPSYWSAHYGIMTREYTDWNAIGMELGRAAVDCKTKHRLIQESALKKGRFTAEDDALIYKRVEEWGDKGKRGLWVALEKEMGRTAGTIRHTWMDRLSKKPQ